ncbi:MAG: hypothetical protein WBD10_12180 [Acidobacteriaceae bacterium]
MKIPALLSIALLALAPVTGCASGHDFDRVVATVEHHYAVHAQRVPMMGLVSFCAWAGSRGGVMGMRIAEFDNLTLRKSDDLSRLVRDSLDKQWQPFVTDREAGGEQSVIFVQPHGHSMRMLIADYQNGELDLVRMEINGERLQQWLRDPKQSARERNHHETNSAIRYVPGPAALVP